ncbi:hypothetical protein L7F22_062579 [Adiantum nelumboides]|nr:hypothetical protein [Adiantum nelumboides]
MCSGYMSCAGEQRQRARRGRLARWIQVSRGAPSGRVDTVAHCPSPRSSRPDARHGACSRCCLAAAHRLALRPTEPPLPSPALHSQYVHTCSVGQVLANLASKDGLVTDEESTAYWQQHGPVKSSDISYSKDKQADLWTWTLATVADTDAERKRFAGLQG